MRDIRDALCALQGRATEMGLRIDLGNMTPREIRHFFEAAQADARRRAHRADFQAFLIGRYVALAMHAPGRYPKRPNAVRDAAHAMSPEVMKRCFADMAERGKANGDG